MNVFYLSRDPVKAAFMQIPKHKVKMVLECAQLLSCCHRVYGDEREVLYKKTHENHPSAVWVRESSQHYDWLYQHFLALGAAYTELYGKTHLSITKLKGPLMAPPSELEDNGFVDPPQCMPDEYKDIDTVQAYTNYYQFKRETIGQ